MNERVKHDSLDADGVAFMSLRDLAAEAAHAQQSLAARQGDAAEGRRIGQGATQRERIQQREQGFEPDRLARRRPTRPCGIIKA